MQWSNINVSRTIGKWLGGRNAMQKRKQKIVQDHLGAIKYRSSEVLLHYLRSHH